MKMTRNFAYLAPTLISICTMGGHLCAWAQGTAFTYQGRLNDTVSAANGNYDFRFRLASDALANNYVGGNVFTNGVQVSSGLFTVTLDFGVGVFTGSNLWLEVDVRTNGAGAYTVLSPLQAMTPTPYAVMAASASNLLGVLPATQLSGAIPSGQLAGTYSGVINFNNAADTFSGAFSGNGGGLTNVNAAKVGGLSPTSFWQVGGNNIGPAQFLGSTNFQAVEIWAGGGRGLRMEPTVRDSAHSNIINVVAGSAANFVSNGVYGATIAGGGAGAYILTATNSVNGDFGTVAGGYGNTSGQEGTVAGGAWNTSLAGGAVGGGFGNQTSGGRSTISGGQNNVTSAGFSTIGGGVNNTNSGYEGTISGGSFNTTTGENAMIPGGRMNTAEGSYGFAAGYRAKSIHDGTFVWADSTEADFSSSTSNQFLIRATNGVGINKNSPASALDVNGTVTATAFSGSGSALTGVAVLAGGNNFTGDQIIGTGKLGIGVNPPDAPLHVASGSAGSVAANPASIAVFERSTSGYVSLLAPSANELGILFGNPNANTDGGIIYNNPSVPSGLEFRTGTNITKMVVLANGNVGIGLTGPTNKLHVVGGATFSSGGTGANQDVVWTPGSASWSFTSDRHTKEKLIPVNSRNVLEKVAKLPVAEWSYIGYSQRHIGPMAQDFHAAFPLNASDTSLNDADLHGVELAAIQGLNQKLEERIKEKDSVIEKLEQRTVALENTLRELQQALRQPVK